MDESGDGVLTEEEMRGDCILVKPSGDEER